MIEYIDEYALRALVALPLLGAVVSLLFGLRSPTSDKSWAANLARFHALTFALAELATALLVVARLAQGAALSIVDDWMRAGAGVDLAFAISPLSAALAVAISFVTLLSVVGTVTRVRQRPGGFFFWLLVCEGALIGTMCAADLFLSLLLLDVAVASLFVLVLVWGGAERMAAARRFLTAQAAGTALLTAALVGLAWEHYRRTGMLTFHRADLAMVALPAAQQTFLLILAMLGLGLKAGLFPLHWHLAPALREAPGAAAILLACGLAKVTLTWLVEFLPSAFPDAWAQAGAPLGCLGVSGILFAATSLVLCRNVRCFVAESTTLHGGLVVLGMATTEESGWRAVAFDLPSQTLSLAGVLLIGGLLAQRAGRSDSDSQLGLGHPQPVRAVFLGFFALSTLGIPGLNGYPAIERIVVSCIGISRSGPEWWAWLGVAAAGAVALATVFGGLFVLRVLWGRRPEGEIIPGDPHPAISANVLTIQMILVAVIVTLGARPALLLDPLGTGTHRAMQWFIGQESMAQAVIGPAAFPADLLFVPWWSWVAIVGMALTAAGAMAARRIDRSGLALAANAALVAAAAGTLPTDRLLGYYADRTFLFQAAPAGMFQALAAAGALVGLLLAARYLRAQGQRMDRLADLSGLGADHPGAAVTIALCVASLAGAPLTAGGLGVRMLMGSAVATASPVAAALAANWVVVTLAGTRWLVPIYGPVPSTHPPARPLPGLRGQLMRAGLTAIVVLLGILAVLPHLLIERLM